ncbi:hypothetical protein MKX01_011695, partial [Papaver californicum]
HKKALEKNELPNLKEFVRVKYLKWLLQNWGLESELLRTEVDAANIHIEMGKYDEAVSSLGGVIRL